MLPRREDTDASRLTTMDQDGQVEQGIEDIFALSRLYDIVADDDEPVGRPC